MGVSSIIGNPDCILAAAQACYSFSLSIINLFVFLIIYLSTHPQHHDGNNIERDPVEAGYDAAFRSRVSLGRISAEN